MWQKQLMDYARFDKLNFGTDGLFYKGIEKEGHRVNLKGALSQTSHPDLLGSKLTHPYITTDYSESLLELVTPVFSTSRDALLFLKKLHTHVLNATTKNNEIIWNASLPPKFDSEDEIQIANFGSSFSGLLKNTYRKGLSYRYGKSMQAIAGIHYNVSFNEDFILQGKKSINEDDYRSQEYFHLIRNFKRYSFILSYLFGATPVVDESFLKNKNHKLKKITNNTYGLPYATSLRMGGLGYTSSTQNGIEVYYDDLSNYIKAIEGARLRSYKPYEEIGEFLNGKRVQLNTNLIQIDNEFYSNIRPKRVAKRGESALQALHQGGVQYVEVRLLDINPFLEAGIDEECMDFIDLFLLYCYLMPSLELSKSEMEIISLNNKEVVENGRSPQSSIYDKGTKILTPKYVENFLLEMKKGFKGIRAYEETIDFQLDKLNNKELPSEKLYNTLLDSNMSYHEFILNESIKNKDLQLKREIDSEFESLMNNLKISSIKELKELESIAYDFEESLKQYFLNIKIKGLSL